jgi:hypothetical protein
MNISAPTNATLGTSTDTATIEDEDKDNPTIDTPPNDKEGDKPTLSVSSVTVTEGTDPYAQFIVSLSNESIQDVVFDLSLANIEALGLGTDYGSTGSDNIQISTNGGTSWSNVTSATITAGSTSLLVRTPINNDLIDENNETFKLTATVTAGDVTNSTPPFGIGTIIDNDTNVVIGTPLNSIVDEDDLPEGSDVSKESLSTTKSLDVTAGTDTFDIKFNNITDGQDSGLTQDGNTIYYYLDNTSHILTASTSSSEGGITSNNTIFTNTINNPTSGSASYTFDLQGAIDHATANAENTENLNFDIIATQNSGYTTTDSFTVSVTDDVPTVYDHNDSIFIGPKTTNIVIVMDVSGSMSYSFAGASDGSNDRLNAAKDSAIGMIKAYKDLGAVNIMVTTFGGATMSTLSSGGSEWMTSNQAETQINLLTAGGGTRYSSAMDHTSDEYISSYTAGDVPNSDYTAVYFISDGEPNNGYSPADSTKWDDFVNRPEITSLDAVGVSSALGLMNLQIVSGINPAGDAPFDNSNTPKVVVENELNLTITGDAYIATSAAEMQVKLLGSTEISVEGNIFSDGTVTLIGKGADGAYVTSVVIGSKTYSYDGTSIKDELNASVGTGSIMTDIETTLTDGVNGIGSKITLDFDTGIYSYTVNSTLSGTEYNEVIRASVIDTDGDTTSKDITLKVNTSKTGTTGDDTMLFDDTQALDYLAGSDSLVLDKGINLDFDTKSATIANVEKVDLNSNGDHSITNLGIQDVLDMTDSNNVLEILGNAGDSVNLKDGDGGNWINTGTNETIDGQDYDIYSKSGDNTAVTLKIDQDITII